MNLREPESEHGNAGRGNGPDSTGAPDQGNVESTQVRPAHPAPEAAEARPAAPEATSPVLGLAVIYSEIHESTATGLDPRLGRVFPLRQGDVLFLGRHPAPAEVLRRDGESCPPTFCHLFPHGEPYGYVSRRHLTVEMDGLGGAVVTDYSRYGIHLARAARCHRRDDPDGPPESHRIDGEETVTLMDDLGDPTDPDLNDRRSHYRLRILPASRTSVRTAETEEPS